jgi:acyl carrier protein
MDPVLHAYLARRDETLQHVRHLLIQSLRLSKNPDELDPDMALFGSGLGGDSIDAVEVVIAIETEFGINLGDDIFGRANMRTINGLVDLVLSAPTATPTGRRDA